MSGDVNGRFDDMEGEQSEPRQGPSCGLDDGLGKRILSA